ncbi:MAG TPA: DNA mismatch repair endonuclease MutL [Bacteroidales bacterium]|nr:DNA mismatch repair endonuclease MutL [Bacteroidales bacterium]
MTDIIHLLPDSVANQIAAGEVVQRPASALKELLENSIDAGATEVTVIIREAGKSLIQVVDNGCGMSERDARMCFERHATSKITKADDLLAIRTLGFRGEALASIASVARVELMTRRIGDEIGSRVVVEGTELKSQTPVSCPTGTSVSVKNLFFNVPARRNFLKSNTLELKYILEEFFRIALVNPAVAFALYNQDKILHRLPHGKLKQRIINLFGASYGQKLVPLEQNTDLVNLSGFIGKPEFAKKTKGEQYFFTNGRYMRSPYLHHAVENAFRELISPDAFPSYFIFMEVDPTTIDVNIHPTKTEINFQDFKSIYSILFAAVKLAIGKFTLSPRIDFEVEPSMDPPPLPTGTPVRQPAITINADYNPFDTKGKNRFRVETPADVQKDALHHFYHETTEGAPVTQKQELISDAAKATASEQFNYFQLNNTFLVTHTRRGVVVIDQQHAHERILYERFLNTVSRPDHSRQQLLIPVTLRLNSDDLQLLEGWKDYFSDVGFEISAFGRDSILVSAVPVDSASTDPKNMIESLLESIKTALPDNKSSRQQILARSLAKRSAIRRGKKLEPAEIRSIIENLMACHVPDLSPEGKPTLLVLSFDDLMLKFRY